MELNTIIISTLAIVAIVYLIFLAVRQERRHKQAMTFGAQFAYGVISEPDDAYTAQNDLRLLENCLSFSEVKHCFQTSELPEARLYHIQNCSYCRACICKTDELAGRETRWIS